MRRQRGFTLLEVAVAMAVFGIFLIVVFTLTSEMRGYEKKLPVNFMRNPQIMSVIARMRRDVLDVQVPPSGIIYLEKYEGYENSKKTLIIETLIGNGVQVIVWDFSEPGVAKRVSYNVGVKSQWVARGLPSDFSLDIDAVKFDGHPYGVRIQAKDSNGQLAIDQILQPRTHD
ncbi:MAG: type II secretion system protein J [Thermoanaerobaculia bacterium]